MAYIGDKKRVYQNTWLNLRRLAWIESQGGKCVKCGSEERLEIDHINRHEKSMKISALWSRSASVREVELSKCQVLCHTCHKEKTIAESTTAKCGQIAMYNKGCRCDECREANRLRVSKGRELKKQRLNTPL